MKTIYTAGVFSLIHAGHLSLLQRSKALAGEGGKLVVGVLTDDGAAAYKDRPVVPQDERLRMVAALGCVDAVFLQPGTDPTPVLLALAALGIRPAAMTHGTDWTELREGNETLAALGMELVLLPLEERQGERLSTTRTVSKIRGMA